MENVSKSSDIWNTTMDHDHDHDDDHHDDNEDHDHEGHTHIAQINVLSLMC